MSWSWELRLREAWCWLEGIRPRCLVVQSLVRWVPTAFLESSLTSVPFVRGLRLALGKDSVAFDTYGIFTAYQAPH